MTYVTLPGKSPKVLVTRRASSPRPLVAKQVEGQAVLFDEPLVRLYGIRTYTYHLGFQVPELLVLVPEGTGFLGATRRVVFGVRRGRWPSSYPRSPRDSPLPPTPSGA